MITEKLKEVEKEDLPKLKQMYLLDWPKYSLGHGILHNYEQWYEKDPSYSDGKVYCLNGDCSDGTLIVIVSFECLAHCRFYFTFLFLQDKQAIFAYTVNEDLSNLKRLIQVIPQKRIVFSAISDHHVDVVKETMYSMKFKQYMSNSCYLFHLPKEKALEFDITPRPGTVLHELSEDHVTQMHQVYPFSEWHTIFQFTLVVRFNVNVGLFDEMTGELMGWCLRYPNGLLNALQV